MSSDTTSDDRRSLLGALSHDTQLPPRSTVVATVLGVTGLLWVGISAGSGIVAVLGLLVGITLAIGIVQVGQPDRVGILIGGIMLLGAVGGAGGLVLYGVATGTPADGGLGIAGVLVGLGIARFRIGAIGDGAVANAVGWVFRISLLTGVLTMLVGVVRADITELFGSLSPDSVVNSLLSPTTLSGTVLGFVVVSWLAFGGIWMTVAMLPPAAVVPERKRAQYQQLLSRSISITGALFCGGGTALALLYLSSVETGIAASVVEPAIGVILGSTLVRVVLFRVFLTGVVVAGLVVLGRSAGARVVLGRPTWLLSGVVLGFGLLVGSALGTEPAIGLLEGTAVHGGLQNATAVAGPTTIGFGIATVLLGAVGAGLLIFPVMSLLDVLPSDTAGPRLALTGLLVAAVAGAAGDAAAIAVFASVIFGVVVWDIGEHAAGLITDVGATPAHRDGELVHAGGSALLGVVALLVTGTVYLLRGILTPNGQGILITVTLVSAVVLVLTVLLGE